MPSGGGRMPDDGLERCLVVSCHCIDRLPPERDLARRRRSLLASPRRKLGNRGVDEGRGDGHAGHHSCSTRACALGGACRSSAYHSGCCCGYWGGSVLHLPAINPSRRSDGTGGLLVGLLAACTLSEK